MTTRDDLATDALPERAEAMLADWPAPARDEAAWAATALAIDEAARVAPASSETSGDVLAAPLPREADEPETAAAPDEPEPAIELDLERAPARLRGGETPAPPPSSGRLSLAELARASQGQRAATPPPPTARSGEPAAKPVERRSLAERASALALDGPPSSERKTAEERKEGSGSFDLAAMMASARASAPPSPPSTQVPVGARSYAPEPLSKAMPSRFPLPPPVPIVRDPSSSSRGIYVIGGVALAGLAAAGALFIRRPTAEPAPVAAASASAEPEAVAALEPTPSEPAASATARSASAGAKLALATPPPAANGTKTNLTAGGALVIKPGAAPTETAAVPAATATPAGDLGGAMKTAAGATGSEPTSGAEQKTAAAGGASGSLPSTPSQGAVQGALGSKMSVARGCVKGMDAPSRANLVFSSDGKVKSITISGAAAGTAAEPCIKRALASANVGPFVQPSFSVGWTVRP